MRVLSESFLDELTKHYSKPVFLYDFFFRKKIVDEEIGVGDGSRQLFHVGVTPVVRMSETIKWGGRNRHYYTMEYATGSVVFHLGYNVLGYPYNVFRESQIPAAGETVYASYVGYSVARYVNFHSAVQWEGFTYAPHLIHHSEVKHSTRFESTTFDVMTNGWEDFMFQGWPTLRNSIVVIRQIFRGVEGQTQTPYITGFLDTFGVSDAGLTLSFIGRGEVSQLNFPRRTLADKCQWRFNAHFCKFDSERWEPPAPEVDTTFCPKTFSECRRRNNLYNFGGFDFPTLEEESWT